MVFSFMAQDSSKSNGVQIAGHGQPTRAQMIENFAGDGNQNEIVAAVAFPVGNPRRPVEPVEFAPVEFLSVNARAKSFCENFLNELRNFQTRFCSVRLQLFILPDFLALPHKVNSPDLPHRHMIIVFRVSPITRQADVFVLLVFPILAMFARPGFRAIRGTAEQHEIVGLEFVSLSGHLVWHTMVNLQICLVHRFQIDETPAAIFFDQLFFDFFGPTGAPAEAMELLLRRVGEPVGGDFAAIGGGNMKGFELNAQFPNVTRGSRGVIVTVFIFQLFGRDVPVFENVINDGLRAFPGDRGAQFKKLFWIFWLCHKERVFPSTAFVRRGACGALQVQLPTPPPAPEKDTTITLPFHSGQARWPARNARPQFPPASNAAWPAAACRSCDFPAARRSSPDSGHFSDSTPRVAPRNHRTQSRRNTASRVPRRRLDTAGPYITRHLFAHFPPPFFTSP